MNNLNQVASETQGSVTRANAFDADGNLTSDGVNTYSYTYGNRLVGASRPGMTASYAYDGDDRRTVKIVGGVMTRTLWSGADEVAELDAGGAVLRRFIPDGSTTEGSPAMDRRVAQVSSAGVVSWFHTDHQGSVVAPKTKVPDASGHTTATASYSPYGEFATPGQMPPGLGAGGGVFGYTGRQFDAEAGLYQYRARYYHPRLGQFLSTDPIGTKDDPNLTLYVLGDPVNYTDPTGEGRLGLFVKVVRWIRRDGEDVAVESRRRLPNENAAVRARQRGENVEVTGPNRRRAAERIEERASGRGNTTRHDPHTDGNPNHAGTNRPHYQPRVRPSGQVGSGHTFYSAVVGATAVGNLPENAPPILRIAAEVVDFFNPLSDVQTAYELINDCDADTC